MYYRVRGKSQGLGVKKYKGSGRSHLPCDNTRSTCEGINFRGFHHCNGQWGQHLLCATPDQ